uniref:Uncharacterized protein n=1 Tax=Chenopodium quinoa TaxID=63459 RepID=A0A803MF59_CHEQI
MKLFGWMHGKFNGRSQSNNTSSTKVHASNKNQTPQLGAQKEEFSDWPQGFLSIGTLFNKSTKDDNIKENSPPSSQNPILDFTLEEVKELQKELNALMSSNDLNSKDVYLDYNGSKLIGKKSLKFLLKKAFICGVGGMGPTRSLKDPTLTVPKSRISKILRAMLRKKIYPQTSCPNMSKKRHIKELEAELHEVRSSTNTKEESHQMQFDAPSTTTNDMNNNDQLELKAMVDVIAAEAHEMALAKENDELRAKIKVLLEDNRKLLVLLRDGRKLLGILRGENVVLIGELAVGEEELPPHMTCVSEAEIKQAQKAEREACDLKGMIRKRMEFLDFD